MLNPFQFRAKKFVSQSIKIKGIFDQPLQNALVSIDLVHRDGSLPPLTMQFEYLTQQHGYYLEKPNHRLEIAVSEISPHPDLTAVHEIGHFLDMRGIGKTDEFASYTDPILKEWRDEIKQSASVLHLKKVLQSGSSQVEEIFANGRKVSYTVNTEYILYLLSPEELWARSYAQFIAVKSSNSELLRQLDGLRRIPPNAFYYAKHWGDSEFQPIMAAIEFVFKRLEWIK